MNAVQAERMREFLGDSLALWGVEGSVEPGTSPVLAVIRVNPGTTVWIERPAGEDVPWRWFVRWRDPDMNAERSRPCASLVGLLSTMRVALGIVRGDAVRIVPPRVSA